jgi:NADH-quinone oxidoreductase subunit N
MSGSYLASLAHYIPEVIACLTMVGLLIVEATYKTSERRSLFYFFATFGLVLTAISLIISMKSGASLAFTGSVAIDSFSGLSKLIMVLGTLGAIYLCKESRDLQQETKPEFVILSVGVLIGGMLLASAHNMLIFYIGIETLSILSYVLASLKKNDEKSSEAGLKYSLYGGISAGIMLFGMSHIFGVLGTIQFSEMAAALANLSTMQIAIVLPSFLLFLAGIGYKIACVPFHMWSPDVYEGSPLPVTAFFSIVPKVAGMAALIRVSLMFFGNEGALQVGWIGTLSVIAALTMTVGNVSAIGQKSIKRMLAYSSIGHAGVMLLAAVVMNELGTTSFLFYAITYLFMTLTAFFIVSFVQDQYGNDYFDRFKGLAFKHPLMAIMMSIVMFSLAGIPPFSGFVAKFNILSAVISKKYYALAIIAGLNSVVSLYYYLKIVRLMVFKPQESEETVAGFTLTNQALIIGLTIPVVLLGIFWSKILHLASGSGLLLP